VVNSSCEIRGDQTGGARTTRFRVTPPTHRIGQVRSALLSPPAGVHHSTINFVAALSRCTKTTSVRSATNISPDPSPVITPPGIALPATFTSPGHIPSSPSTGSTDALWSAKRGSLRRSASFREPSIDPNVRRSLSNEHSIPEILGEPSARMVAIVLCR